MRRIRAFFVRLAGLFGKTRRERDLADEIASNLELHIQDNLRAGLGASCGAVETRRHREDEGRVSRP
jgi:hypothetical protein